MLTRYDLNPMAILIFEEESQAFHMSRLFLDEI